jgi:hypothetical protein
VNHHTWLICWNGFFFFFLPDLILSHNPPNLYLLCSWECVPLCPTLFILMVSFETKYFYIIVVWGHIMVFTKVITIYLSWIHPLHYSPLIPSSPWNRSFDEVQFYFFCLCFWCPKKLLHNPKSHDSWLCFLLRVLHLGLWSIFEYGVGRD